MTSTPTVADAKALIESLPEDSFREVMYWIVTDEKRRRESSVSSNAARVDMVRTARDGDPTFRPVAREDGAFIWSAPTSIFAAFLPGEIVVHGEVMWRSVDTGPNMSTPGMDPMWEEYIPRPEPQPVATAT